MNKVDVREQVSHRTVLNTHRAQPAMLKKSPGGNRWSLSCADKHINYMKSKLHNKLLLIYLKRKHLPHFQHTPSISSLTAHVKIVDIPLD